MTKVLQISASIAKCNAVPTQIEGKPTATVTSHLHQGIYSSGALQQHHEICDAPHKEIRKAGLLRLMSRDLLGIETRKLYLQYVKDRITSELTA